MFQEDAEQYEYDRAVREAEDERRRGTGMVDTKRDDWMPEDEHGNAVGEEDDRG